MTKCNSVQTTMFKVGLFEFALNWLGMGLN